MSDGGSTVPFSGTYFDGSHQVGSYQSKIDADNIIHFRLNEYWQKCLSTGVECGNTFEREVEEEVGFELTVIHEIESEIGGSLGEEKIASLDGQDQGQARRGVQD